LSGASQLALRRAKLIRENADLQAQATPSRPGAVIDSVALSFYSILELLPQELTRPGEVGEDTFAHGWNAARERILAEIKDVRAALRETAPDRPPVLTPRGVDD